MDVYFITSDVVDTPSDGQGQKRTEEDYKSYGTNAIIGTRGRNVRMERIRQREKRSREKK